MGADKRHEARKQQRADLLEEAAAGLELSTTHIPRFREQRPRTPAEAFLPAAGLAVAGFGEKEPWYRQLDPLDVLFLGASGQYYDSPGKFGAARTRWVRRIRGSTLWPAVEDLARLAAVTAVRFAVPLDDQALSIALCRMVEKAEWAQIPITPVLLPGPEDETDHTATLPEPAPDADEQVAAFWRRIDDEIPSGTTVADTLRTGLSLTGVRRPMPASGPHLLATALECPVRSEEWTWLSAFWWYQSQRRNSPLHSVLGIIWEAEINDLDAVQTLARLFNCPQFHAAVDRADARWRANVGLELPGIVVESGIPIAISRGMIHHPGGTIPLPDRQTRHELADLLDL